VDTLVSGLVQATLSPKVERLQAMQTRGCSSELENHAAAAALNNFAYNFIKIQRTLRMTPAMAAGVTDRLSSVERFGGPLGVL
jgi:hypothetical protein